MINLSYLWYLRIIEFYQLLIIQLWLQFKAEYSSSKLSWYFPQQPPKPYCPEQHAKNTKPVFS